MNPLYQQIKGLHPGFFLERELQKRKIQKGKFAISIGEYPQTLTAITKGTRKLNTALALRIEKNLGLQEGFLVMLQASHDIEKLKKQEKNIPDLSKIRSALFWDTDLKKIQWQKQKKSVIKRVFERGNDTEKNEMTRFYGKEAVGDILNTDEK